MLWYDDPEKVAAVTTARDVLDSHAAVEHGCPHCGGSIFIPRAPGMYSCAHCDYHAHIPGRREVFMAEAILDILGVPWKDDEPLEEEEEE